MRQYMGKRLGMILGSVFMGAACADSPTPPVVATGVASATAQLARAEVDAAVQGRSSRGFEDEILRMEARHTGLGGVFVDSSGRFVIYVKDSSESARASAQSAFRTIASTLQLAPERRQ